MTIKDYSSLCSEIGETGRRRRQVEDLGDLIGYKMDNCNPYSNHIYFIKIRIQGEPSGTASGGGCLYYPL